MHGLTSVRVVSIQTTGYHVACFIQSTCFESQPVILQMNRPLVFLAVAALASLNAVAEDKFSDQDIEFFEKEVQPILVAKCVKCHNGDKPKGSLRLTTREHVLKGGESGPAVSLKDIGESTLLQAVNYDGFEMPPDRQLPQAQIDVFTRWIQSGLAWPADVEELVLSEENQLEPPVNERTKQFWSYQRVKRPDVPEIQTNADWVASPIDAFVLARLQDAGLSPSEPADKIALLRRAYYDMIGLPPSPKEVEEYLESAIRNPQSAFEQVVDRLLKSPHYGEKWGRYWLDLVRYAETDSYERDGAKPFVWRYRDYVIKSLNADKPYDQFIREQLAGDELDEVTPDSIIATGFYRLGVWQDEPVDPKQEFYEDIDDIVRTTSEVFLGMTAGCARCHYHKLDPYPQRDYYRMVSFFRNVRRQGTRGLGSVMAASVREIEAPAHSSEQQRAIADHKRKIEGFQRELKKLEDLVRPKLVGGEVDDFEFETNRVFIMKKYIKKGINEAQFKKYENITRQRNNLRNNPPKGNAKALCIKEHGPNVAPTHVLSRGSAHAPGEEVQPGFPSVLGFDDPVIPEPPAGAQSCGRRRVLAEWIASPENPLTARVMANRLWQYHFGRGIVRSPNNFGFQGDRPTHPRLLDWLANELVAGGWKLKRLHKLIMMSNTYQMSSKANEAGLAKDRENNLFWRYDMRRLMAEEIRDSILAVNGTLNLKMLGPSIYPIIPDEVKAGQSVPGKGWGNSSPEERARRSIYIHIKRSLVVPMIASFDGPDLDSTCPVRFVTTQPTQSLGMFNGKFMNDQAHIFADYVREHAGDDTAAQVEMVLHRTCQRKPTDDEIKRGIALLDRLKEKHKVDDAKALDYYCLVALNFNEFIYLD